jgi:thioredoxin reductase (NADPH)
MLHKAEEWKVVSHAPKIKMMKVSCGHEEVIVIGGRNSARQAAVFLSETASKVHILARTNRLSETMSRYLIQRIEKNPKIDVHYCMQIAALEGDTHLESVTWRDKSGATESHPIRHVFIMPEPRRAPTG